MGHNSEIYENCTQSTEQERAISRGVWWGLLISGLALAVCTMNLVETPREKVVVGGGAALLGVIWVLTKHGFETMQV